jgi:hypothetical protein
MAWTAECISALFLVDGLWNLLDSYFRVEIYPTLWVQRVMFWSPPLACAVIYVGNVVQQGLCDAMRCYANIGTCSISNLPSNHIVFPNPHQSKYASKCQTCKNDSAICIPNCSLVQEPQQSKNDSISASPPVAIAPPCRPAAGPGPPLPPRGRQLPLRPSGHRPRKTRPG